ncbi:MAG: histidine kinase, partial [Proteobacteria bacterium]|nr:histidine kinase [Pseudomonadota bacterium]
DFSPCGITLDCDTPILTRHSERYYPWIADVNVALPEVLLVPLHRGAEQLGTLWIVSDELSHFNAGHVEAVKEIAAFVSIALQMHQTEKRLSRALNEQEMLTAEMSHRIKNLLATTGALVQMSSRGSATKDDMTHSLMGRLNALGFAHALVRSEFSSGHEVRAASLHDLLNGVVSPYATPALSGPDVRLGERATNAIALIFHELTTNAAKYGALGAAGGTVSVGWTIEDDKLVLTWTESGGPAPTTTQSGFGSRMVQGTVASLEGAIEYDWKPTGLSTKVSIPTGRIAN